MSDSDKQLADALKFALNVMEKGMQVRMMDCWPALKMPLEVGIKKAEEALARLEDDSPRVWWVWRSRDDGHWSVMKSKGVCVTESFAFLHSAVSAGYDEIYVEAVDAIRAVELSKAKWDSTLALNELAKEAQELDMGYGKTLVRFQAGDRVRCINASSSMLNYGSVYTVNNHSTQGIRLNDFASLSWLDDSHFVLVTDPSSPNEPPDTPDAEKCRELKAELDAAVDYHSHYRDKIDKALYEPRGNCDILTSHLRAIDTLKANATATPTEIEQHVDSELQKAGIDMQPAFERLHAMIASHKESETTEPLLASDHGKEVVTTQEKSRSVLRREAAQRGEDPPDFGTNGGQKCDMETGPCECGAWHSSRPKFEVNMTRLIDRVTLAISDGLDESDSFDWVGCLLGLGLEANCYFTADYESWTEPGAPDGFVKLFDWEDEEGCGGVIFVKARNSMGEMFLEEC